MRLAIAIIVAGCWTAPVPPAAQPAPPPSKPPRDLIVILERTGCFGMCPTYSVTVGSGGMVIWEGEANVATIGARGRQVTRARVDELRRAIDAARFFDLDERGQPRQACSPGDDESCSASIISCTDTPHAIITVIRGGEKHVVDDAHCSDEPTALSRLEDLIDRICGTDVWIGNRAGP